VSHVWHGLPLAQACHGLGGGSHFIGGAGSRRHVDQAGGSLSRLGGGLCAGGSIGAHLHTQLISHACYPLDSMAIQTTLWYTFGWCASDSCPPPPTHTHNTGTVGLLTSEPRHFNHPIRVDSCPCPRSIILEHYSSLLPPIRLQWQGQAGTPFPPFLDPSTLARRRPRLEGLPGCGAGRAC